MSSLEALLTPSERLAYLPNGMNWRAGWNVTTQYFPNDMVLSPTNGNVYIANTTILGGNDPANDPAPSLWTNASGGSPSSSAIAYAGFWDSAKQYYQGDLVIGTGFNNTYESYICIVPQNTQGFYPSVHPNEWTQLSTTPTSSSGTISVVNTMPPQPGPPPFYPPTQSQTSNINLVSATGFASYLPAFTGFATITGPIATFQCLPNALYFFTATLTITPSVVGYAGDPLFYCEVKTGNATTSFIYFDLFGNGLPSVLIGNTFTTNVNGIIAHSDATPQPIRIYLNFLNVVGLGANSVSFVNPVIMRMA